jgi:hypothetical protein
MRRLLVAALTVLTFPTLALAAQPVVPFLPVPKSAAVILNTGSTNTSGYRIVIQRSGAAEFVDAKRRATGRVPASLAAKFFGELESAMPLSKIPIYPCMKSASFGTALFIWWRGQRSPDLTCPANAKDAILRTDAGAIAEALHVSNTPRGRLIPMMPNEPHRMLPSPAASPSPSPGYF